MTDQTETSSKQKTIFLAILFFGGFTLLLIFYLIYKYFRMRRNDIEQQRMIQMHNQQQRDKIRKKKISPLPETILTQSIIDWKKDSQSTNISPKACLNCDQKVDSFLAFDSPINPHKGIILIFMI